MKICYTVYLTDSREYRSGVGYCQGDGHPHFKKKAEVITSVNPPFYSWVTDGKKGLEIRLEAACEAELDEQWSFVGKKSQQRWLWYAVDHATNTVIAYVFGRRKDTVFKRLKALLDPLKIARYYTDDWGAYERHLDAEQHEVGKSNTQKIERKNLNLRTWIKRLARKTICFSKNEAMHDTVIGLLINKVEFGMTFMPKFRFDPLPNCRHLSKLPIFHPG